MKLGKQLLKRLLNRAGYCVYARGWLPAGVDVSQDVTRLLGRQPRTCFDIGANIGQTTRYFHKAWPNARIFAFEPVTETFTTLQQNIASLPRIRAHRLAFGADVERRRIHLFDRSSELSTFTDAGHSQCTSTEEVPVSTVDAFCEGAHIDELDHIKIDTEGSDLEVLRGSTNMLTKGQIRTVLAEVGLHPSDTRHAPLHAMTDWMARHDYFVAGFFDQGTIGKRGWFYCNVLFAHAKATPSGEFAVFNS